MIRGEEAHGADFPAPELRHLLAGDCPRRGASIYERCRVHFPNLVGAFAAREGEDGPPVASGRP